MTREPRRTEPVPARARAAAAAAWVAHLGSSGLRVWDSGANSKSESCFFSGFWGS